MSTKEYKSICSKMADGSLVAYIDFNKESTSQDNLLVRDFLKHSFPQDDFDYVDLKRILDNDKTDWMDLELERVIIFYADQDEWGVSTIFNSHFSSDLSLHQEIMNLLNNLDESNTIKKEYSILNLREMKDYCVEIKPEQIISFLKKYA